MGNICLVAISFPQGLAMEYIHRSLDSEIVLSGSR